MARRAPGLQIPEERFQCRPLRHFFDWNDSSYVILGSESSDGSPRQTNTVQYVGKAHVTSQRIESGIHPDSWHSIRAVADSFLEPGKGSFLVSQHGIQASQSKTADILALCLGLNAAKHCQSLILPACEGIRGSQMALD